MEKQEHDFMWSDEIVQAVVKMKGQDVDNPEAWPTEVREQYENRRTFQMWELRVDSTDQLRENLLLAAMGKRGEPAWFLATEIFSAITERSDGITHDLLRVLDDAMTDAYCSVQRECLRMIPELDKSISNTSWDEIIERVAGANLPPAA